METNVEVPEYNPKGKETINQYLRRVEKYKAIILKDKYNVVLNFVNDWLRAEYESLSEFTNIKESILLKNIKHNSNVVQKYTQIFKNKFEIDLTIDYNNDETREILDLLIKMLSIIDYTLIKREFKDNIVYSIRQL